MLLSKELFKIAKNLDRVKNPNQAQIRRAISTAYYALYHFLINEGVNIMFPSFNNDLKLQITRSFTHSGLLTGCNKFNEVKKKDDKNKKLADDIYIPTDPFIYNLIEPKELKSELIKITQTFRDMQKLRHEADYNSLHKFIKEEALSSIYEIETCFKNWDIIKNDHNTHVFITYSLLPTDSKKQNKS